MTLAQIFIDLKIEAFKSPEVSVLSTLEKHFESVPHTSKQALTPFHFSSYSEAKAPIQEWIIKALHLAAASTPY